MMKILFRGKRIDNGEWIEGFFVQQKEKFYICSNPYQIMDGYSSKNGQHYGFGDFYEVDHETVCQYTGLQDKTGKRIFEGDICGFSIFDYNGYDTQYKGVVVYSGSRFMLWKSKESEYYGDDGGFDLDWVVSQDDEFEVIGNIFDNPDLL